MWPMVESFFHSNSEVSLVLLSRTLADRFSGFSFHRDWLSIYMISTRREDIVTLQSPIFQWCSSSRNFLLFGIIRSSIVFKSKSLFQLFSPSFLAG